MLENSSIIIIIKARCEDEKFRILTRVGSVSSAKPLRRCGTFSGFKEKRVRNLSVYSHLSVSRCRQCESRNPFSFARINMAENSSRSISSRTVSCTYIRSKSVKVSISYL